MEGSTVPRQRRFGRRALLTSAAAGALALVLPIRVRPKGGLALPGAVSLGATPRRFRARLPIPEVISKANITLRIREARVPILPGRKTRMWTYGGTFPGPTIRRPAGHRTTVTFKHDLPRSAGELTVHLHGGHNTSHDDGQPGGLTANHRKSLYCDISPGLSNKASGNTLLIKPGRRRTYTYDLVEDDEPERAAFQWYHDHRLDHTARNVWRGLAGMWIIDDDLDAGLPLPSGRHDIPLLIADRSFDGRNQLTNPFSGSARPPADGVKGRYVLVNGAYAPHHHVAARRYRLRLLNASNFRAYNVYLTQDVPIVQIATESGLMPAPVDRRRVLIGPSERAELIVDFSAAHGKTVQLRSGRRGSGSRASGSVPYHGPLMQFRVGRRERDTSRIPATLRPLPAWVDDAVQRWQSTHEVDKTWKATLQGVFKPTWGINGKTFDPARIDHRVKLGTTEIWRLQNTTGVAHVLHVHSTDFYVLERNGRRPPPWERCLKETFFLDPHEDVVIAGRFTDHLGRFVIHCHMLDHEDHGLMTQFKVVS